MNATDNSAKTNALERFREECRDWILDNCPKEMRNGKTGSETRCWGGRQWSFNSQAQKTWLQRCVEKGWTVPTWPKAYGGAGLSSEQSQIIKQEMNALGIQLPLYSYGITMLGPALLKYGTDEQKDMHLPPIARGEIRWCQGYSEPNAGSDLASLSLKCEDMGDHWKLNGQKIWTSKADVSDWIFMMVRTDSSVAKHKGISFILVDMESPGISVKPIDLISGKSPFCETFIKDVKVPKHYSDSNPSILGELGQGWEVGMYLLSHERGSLGGYTLEGRGHEEPIIDTAIAQFGFDNSGRLNNPILRSKLAAAKIDEAACIALAETLNKKTSEGIEIGANSSLVKYASTQIIQRGYELRMDIDGTTGIFGEVTLRDDNSTSLAQNWLYSRAYTILGGTSEIQLNVIAKRLLGL